MRGCYLCIVESDGCGLLVIATLRFAGLLIIIYLLTDDNWELLIQIALTSGIFSVLTRYLYPD
ncbi:hypothetical protein F4801DRAFT_569900 [Xylaria longipes]|nr:hypothetical protein F4801DRAFT_569900 [Xylaria longipes]